MKSFHYCFLEITLTVNSTKTFSEINFSSKIYSLIIENIIRMYQLFEHVSSHFQVSVLRVSGNSVYMIQLSKMQHITFQEVFFLGCVNEKASFCRLLILKCEIYYGWFSLSQNKFPTFQIKSWFDIKIKSRKVDQTNNGTSNEKS